MPGQPSLFCAHTHSGQPQIKCIVFLKKPNFGFLFLPEHLKKRAAEKSKTQTCVKLSCYKHVLNITCLTKLDFLTNSLHRVYLSNKNICKKVSFMYLCQ